MRSLDSSFITFFVIWLLQRKSVCCSGRSQSTCLPSCLRFLTACRVFSSLHLVCQRAVQEQNLLEPTTGESTHFLFITLFLSHNSAFLYKPCEARHLNTSRGHWFIFLSLRQWAVTQRPMMGVLLGTWRTVPSPGLWFHPGRVKSVNMDGFPTPCWSCWWTWLYVAWPSKPASSTVCTNSNLWVSALHLPTHFIKMHSAVYYWWSHFFPPVSFEFSMEAHFCPLSGQTLSFVQWISFLVKTSFKLIVIVMQNETISHFKKVTYLNTYKK